MSGFNGSAWLRYHQGRRTGVIPAPSNNQHRVICPDCALLMTLEWFVQIHGMTPQEYGARLVESPLRHTLGEADDWADPSDDVVLSREERGPR